MRIQRTSQIITAAVALLSLVTVVCGVISLRYRTLQERNYAHRRVAMNMMLQLAAGSDRLTNAVRGYAATGERSYFDDFIRELEVDRSRDAAIAELTQIELTSNELELLTRAKANSDQLVGIERRAFEAMANKDHAAALTLVYGDEFRTVKSGAMQAIAECRRSLDTRLTSQAEELSVRARLAGYVAVGAIAVSGGAVVSALLFFYRKRVVNPVAALNRCLRDLLARKPGVSIAHQDEDSEIGEVARSLDSYRRSADEVETQRWIKSHVAEASGLLQRAETPSEFARVALSKLVPLLGGGCGALYLLDESTNRFRFIGGYGFVRRSDANPSYAPGEGIVGQCAADQRAVTLRDLPPDYVAITSGVGEASPRVLVATPILSLGRSLAVVEVASFTELTPIHAALLNEMAAMFALNLEILQRNLKTRALLEQTQRQAGELRAQQESLRSIEGRNRLILESTAEGIFGVDTGGRMTFVNASACEMLGFTADELIGLPSHELIHHHHPDGSEYPMAECPMYAAYTRGTASRIDDEFLWRKDGSGLAVEYGATPMLKDGVVVGAVISFTDVTARKEAEAELRKRTDELQQTNFMADRALELTKSGYWHVPLDGSGWYNSSERAARIFGDPPTPDHRYSLERWAEHVRAGDEAAAKITLENFAAAVAGTAPFYDATYAYKRPVDGRVVWIHALGHVVKDADGKPTDMFGVTQDVTAFKEMEAELREAMQKAEEATKAKSAFLANMSHEIRTPMNGILGMTELALDTDLTAEQRDYLNTVKGSADALLALINDILDFSKIEAGRIELDPIEFLLRDAIGDTLNPLALRASSKGLELAYDIAPDVPDALVADIYRLRQVIVNLVGNAIKFTERGEVVVAVRVVESHGDARVLEFAVRDTGIGIPPAAAAKLFRPFEQADAATTRKFGGTGLGLAISRQLVELMGGQVRLESEAGRGSTFAFTTRVKLGTARSTSTPDDAARVLQGKTALIVDDNETNRRILEAMLGHWGLRTLSADSGAKALAVLDRSASAGQPVSLVISDLHMPEMDGFEFIAAVRRHSAFNLLPVVLLTSSASPGDQQRCDELRVAARLLKPVKQSLLLDNVMRIMVGEIRDRAPAPAPAPGPAAGAPGRSLRVLLAEDNPVNVKFALKLLERAGHRVKVVGNGREAVDSSESEPFDVVLMDVQMPEMDGLDATRAIRAREAGDNGRHIPIIAMTANAMAGDRETCINAGMDGYVTKPVKREVLFEELGRVLAHGGEHAGV